MDVESNGAAIKRIECPKCGHLNHHQQRTCAHCRAKLDGLPVVDGPSADRPSRELPYVPEGVAILAGGFLGAVVSAGLWFSFLSEAAMRLIGGPHYYFNDFLIYVFQPFSALLVAPLGIFWGAAAADFNFRWQQGLYEARCVNWGAAATLTITFFLSLLLAAALFWFLGFVVDFLPFPIWFLLAIPLVMPPVAVFVYLRRIYRSDACGFPSARE